MIGGCGIFTFIAHVALQLSQVVGQLKLPTRPALQDYLQCQNKYRKINKIKSKLQPINEDKISAKEVVEMNDARSNYSQESL